MDESMLASVISVPAENERGTRRYRRLESGAGIQ